MVAQAQDAWLSGCAFDQIEGRLVEAGIMFGQFGEGGSQSGGDALGGEEDLGGKAMAREEGATCSGWTP